MILSDKDEFNLEVEALSGIGSKALLEENYRPDFSVKLLTETKLLKITKDKYLKYLT